MANNLKTIDRFTGEHRFLSNFWICRVVYHGVDYANAETAFQAQKVTDIDEQIRFAELSPGDAKRAGRRVKLRPDWEEIKTEKMAHIVEAKFRQNGDLARMLLDTGDADLIEGNTWGDTTWGVCNGKGENRLGRILTALRSDLRSERAGKSQSFRITLRSIYSGGAADLATARVWLYGPKNLTDRAKEELRAKLRETRHIMLHGPLNSTWEELTAIKEALVQMQEATGIPYQLDPYVETDALVM